MTRDGDSTAPGPSNEPAGIHARDRSANLGPGDSSDDAESRATTLDRHYRHRLIAYASSLLGDPMSAEDVAQEVLHRALDVEVLPTSFRAWLYTVTRNACLNRLRALGRRPDRDHLASRQDLAASLTGHVTLLSRAERHAALAAALRHLSLDQEEAIRLRYTEGLTRADVAHVLGVPESTVKSRLFEGLQTLRRFMAQPKERD